MTEDASEMLSPNHRLDMPGSPTAASSGKAKRRRKALSCYDCRRRKLRCDREYPACSRCRKAGIANTCSYDERSIPSGEKHDEATVPPSKQSTSTPQAPSDWPVTTPVSYIGSIGRLETRPLSLEASQTSGTWQLRGDVSTAVKDRSVEQRPSIRADAEEYLQKSRESTPPETIIFRGENFKTQYYGGSNPTSLIAHFPELRTFMRESIMQHTSLPRVQKDLKSLQVKWKTDKTNVLPLVDFELFQLLPDRDTVDHLVGLYFDTCETTYRILHAPSFWKEYQIFWEDPKAATPAFLIVLFLVMAAVSCISVKQQPTYIGDSAMARERAVLWIEVAEWWLSRHSQKNIYLAIWQVRCLLVLAKQINIVKKKRTWTVAGNLVREAMSAGFHRDPSLLGEKVSIFDQEMRRRLWATMTELELQASVDRGMPSASAGVPSDCSAVLNVNDEDLSVDCEKPPRQKPWNEYTANSFLHLARGSFALRVSLNSLVNDMASPSRYDEVLNYEDLVTKELQKLPPRLSAEATKNERGLSMIARTLLDVQLRQFLILLHGPFARQAESKSRYSLSRMICFNAAASMLEQHSQLDGSGNFLLLLLRHDYFRAALTLCHNMYISLTVQNDLLLTSNSNTFIHYVEDALRMLEDRITRLGTGYTHYWYISAGCSLLRSAMRPEETMLQKQQAIDRVARQYYRVLASQEDFGKAKEKILPARLSKTELNTDPLQLPSNTTAAPGLSFLDPTIPQIPLSDNDLPLDQFYFGDPAAWTFENLWEFE